MPITPVDHLQDRVRVVIYRAYHPTTNQLGWAGFVESGVCVHLGWHSSRFAICCAARKARRRA